MRFDGGWVKLHRSVFDHWIGSDGLTLAIWVKLLAWANYKDKMTKVPKQGLAIVKRGQVITSASELAEKLQFDRMTVTRRLQLLQDGGCIEQQVSSHGRIITICNYDEYQSMDDKSCATDDRIVIDQSSASDQPVIDQRAHSEEGKKERRKEGKNTELHIGKPTPRDLAELWNTLKDDRQTAITLITLRPGSKRWLWAEKRLKENPDLGYWRDIISRIAKSDFCTGSNDRVWIANFEFLVRAETHIKVLEGQYDNRCDSLRTGEDLIKLLKEQDAKDGYNAP